MYIGVWVYPPKREIFLQVGVISECVRGHSEEYRLPHLPCSEISVRPSDRTVRAP
jgi:hypothetical protein